MVHIRLCTSRMIFVMVGLLCLLLVRETKAGKMARSKAVATPLASSKSTTSNATFQPDSGKMESNTMSNVASAATDNDTKQSTQTSAVAASADGDDEDDDAISSLSMWGIVQSFWNWIRGDLNESLLGADDDDETASAASNPVAAIEGRTFGKIRRLQMALIPIIFKFGVLSAMVAFLVMLGMKTLFLVKMLLLLNAAAILGKFLTLKTNLGHQEYHPAHVTWGYSNWSPHPPISPHHGWSSSDHVGHSGPNKEIHLHIHGASAAHPQPQVSAYSTYGNGASHSNTGGWERRTDPYSGYESAGFTEADIENELNNQGPILSLPTKYPANHRY